MDDDGYQSALDDDNYSDYGDYYDDQEDMAVEEDQKEEDMLDNLQDSEDSSKSDYIVLKQEEIQQLQSDEITKLSSVLSISKSDACCLLPHFNWRASTVQEEWCAEEDKLREKFGLLKEPVVRFRSRDSITCGVCFDDYSYGSGSVFSAACGHPFCGDCWNGYISTSINEGPGCLMLTCPEPKCKAPVGPDLIPILTSKEEYERYKHYLLRSYVEQSRTTKWCPAPDCDYAVKFNADGTGNYDVSCQCTNDFCWNCTEEIHRPVSCMTVNKWVMKNKDDSQNSQWIQVNTKPCPKCNKPIEKNQGCNHMTCRPPCGFHFCWYCLGDFKNHDHVCNGFSSLQEAVKANRSNESRDKRKLRRELERYIHYYERWATNLSSKQKALEEFNKVQSEHIGKLAQTQAESNCSLKFITEAWQQIIKCRQILRWTYAYGYYIPEEQSVKLQLFEHLQWQAENSLERLHHCAENDCKVFLEAEEPKQGFHDFRIKLTELTNNTAKYFEELVRGLENGLSEVETYANPPPPSPPPSPSPPDRWACELCTYVNEGYATRCEMCDDQEPEEEDML